MFKEPFGPPDESFAVPDDPSVAGIDRIAEFGGPVAGGGTDGDGESVCEGCIHHFSMEGPADVKNRKPDGTKFMRRNAYCTRVDTMMVDLRNRQITQCSQRQGTRSLRSLLSTLLKWIFR